MDAADGEITMEGGRVGDARGVVSADGGGGDGDGGRNARTGRSDVGRGVGRDFSAKSPC